MQDSQFPARIPQFVSNDRQMEALLRFVARYSAKHATAAFNFASLAAPWKYGRRLYIYPFHMLEIPRYSPAGASDCGDSELLDGLSTKTRISLTLKYLSTAGTVL